MLKYKIPQIVTLTLCVHLSLKYITKKGVPQGTPFLILQFNTSSELLLLTRFVTLGTITCSLRTRC